MVLFVIAFHVWSSEVIEASVIAHPYKAYEMGFEVKSMRHAASLTQWK